jgi:hypothetical protein
MRGLPRRVMRLEQQVVPEVWGAIPIVDPRLWSKEIRAAYERADAANDLATLADIVEGQTGNRPAYGRTDGAPVMIEIGVAKSRADGLSW